MHKPDKFKRVTRGRGETLIFEVIQVNNNNGYPQLVCFGFEHLLEFITSFTSHIPQLTTSFTQACECIEMFWWK